MIWLTYMPMYTFIPADEDARKAPPRPPVFVSDDMATIFESNDVLKGKSNGENLECKSCNKTYKNKKV